MGIAKLSAVAFLGLMLAACQTAQPTTAVVTVTKPPLMIPSVDNIKIQDVDWYVINKNAKAGSESSPDAVFGKTHSDSLLAITPKGYESMATNQENLVKVIRQYQAQVKAYKDYYSQQPIINKEDANGSSN